MFKEMKKRIKNEKGLTLIELLAVIVILGIIAAIAIPAIGGIIENSRYKAVKSDALNVISAANIYYTDTNETTTAVSVQDLIDEDYLDTAGKIPVDATISTTSPRAITTDAIDYTGGKTVTFNAATVDAINNDPNKGSGAGGYTITATP